MSASEELRKLEDAMTLGPWRWGTGEIEDGQQDFPDGYLVTVAEEETSLGPLSKVIMEWGEFRNEEDRSMIELRNALPELIAVVDNAETVAHESDSVGNWRHGALRQALSALTAKLEECS